MCGLWHYCILTLCIQSSFSQIYLLESEKLKRGLATSHIRVSQIQNEKHLYKKSTFMHSLILQMFTEQGFQRVYDDYSKINNINKCITAAAHNSGPATWLSLISCFLGPNVPSDRKSSAEPNLTSRYLYTAYSVCLPNQTQLTQLISRDS